MGYAILEVEAGRARLLEYGCLENPKDVLSGDRLLKLFEALCSIIKNTAPTEFAIEKLYFAKNVKTALSVAQARGVAILAARQNHLEVSEYSPSEVKLALTGYGGADKRQMQKMVSLTLGLKEILRPDDAADAAAIALTHAFSFKRQTP